MQFRDFWYSNVAENIFEIIFLPCCINARLNSLVLRHVMEHKRTEISYLDCSEWVREWEREYCVWEYSDWLWIWRRSLIILQSCRDSSTGSGISNGYWGASLGSLIGLSVKLTSYFCLVPKLKCVLYMQPWCVFFSYPEQFNPVLPHYIQDYIDRSIPHFNDCQHCIIHNPVRLQFIVDGQYCVCFMRSP